MVSTGRQGCVMMATLEWILVNARRLVCVRATCKQARRSVSPTSVFSLFFFIVIMVHSASGLAKRNGRSYLFLRTVGGCLAS